MKSLGRILLATNLTPHSDRAMERAVQLAAEHCADLSVIYALQPGNEAPPAIDRMAPADIEAEIRRHLRAIPKASGLTSEVVVAKGAIDEATRDYAELWKPDLMVAGAHRSDTIKDMFAITTVERISVASPAPLLVVRNKPFGPYGSTLVPVDFLDNSRASIEAAMTLAPGARLHLLHVFDAPGTASTVAPLPANGFEEEFAALLDGIDTRRHAIATSVRHGPAMHEIIEAAHARLPDLIVLGTEGRRGIDRMLMGSTAHEVLEHLPSDILLVRAPENP